MTPSATRFDPRRGFTLVELLGVIVVFATLAAVISPVALEAAGAHRRAATQREAAQRAGHALERVARLLRECPPIVEGEPEPHISVAGAQSITLGDGSKVELLGSTLWLTPAGESAAQLCAGVEVLELEYLGADGATDTISTPDATQRISIRLVVDGFELRTIAFLRVAEGLT